VIAFSSYVFVLLATELELVVKTRILSWYFRVELGQCLGFSGDCNNE